MKAERPQLGGKVRLDVPRAPGAVPDDRVALTVEREDAMEQVAIEVRKLAVRVVVSMVRGLRGAFPDAQLAALSPLPTVVERISEKPKEGIG